MARLAIITGVVLSVIAVVFFIASEMSKTALIPLGIGIPILICGVLAQKENLRMHAMHGAVLFGILGVLGSLMGARKWPALLSGQTVERPLAAWEQLILFVVCTVFVVMCVRSFIAARKARV